MGFANAIYRDVQELSLDNKESISIRYVSNLGIWTHLTGIISALSKRGITKIELQKIATDPTEVSPLENDILTQLVSNDVELSFSSAVGDKPPQFFIGVRTAKENWEKKDLEGINPDSTIAYISSRNSVWKFTGPNKVRLKMTRYPVDLLSIKMKELGDENSL